MITTELPEPPQFNSVEWLEKEVERLQSADKIWERMFNLACHDRDSWQQECETLITIMNRQRDEIRRLCGNERTLVIDSPCTEEELASDNRQSRSFPLSSQTTIPQEAESETQGNNETVPDQGQDSGETTGSGQAGC